MSFQTISKPCPCSQEPASKGTQEVWEKRQPHTSILSNEQPREKVLVSFWWAAQDTCLHAQESRLVTKKHAFSVTYYLFCLLGDLEKAPKIGQI